MPAKVLLKSRLDHVQFGRAVTDDDVDLLICGEADVFKPDGRRLCSVRRGVVAPEHRELARAPAAHAGQQPSQNRGIASGGHREYQRKPDGTVSKTAQVVDEHGNRVWANSSVVGYFDRYPRMPYCRQTAFVINHGDEFDQILPLMADVARCFEATVPDRYAAQMERINRTSHDFRIASTPWTTLTINYNWPTRTHTDKGDLDEGFSCLTVLRSGNYKGGLLVFPAFRVAVDLQDGDLIMMDAHEVHANTPIEGEDGYERIAIVLYYRTKMLECGTAAEELERAKMLRGSLTDEPDDLPAP